MIKYGYTYLTTNKTNGMVYIGKRKNDFDPTYLGSGKYIKRAIKKYGRGNFRVCLIEYADNISDLNSLERKYIAECRQYLGQDMMYNIADGGDGGLIGIFTKSRRKKMSTTRISKCLAKGKNNGMFGKCHTKETREKMKLRKLGVKRGPFTNGHKDKLRKSHHRSSLTSSEFINKKNIIEKIFNTPEFIKYISQRNKDILSMRFGINDGITHTLSEVTEHFGVTKTRVCQIEKMAIRLKF